MLQSYNMHSHKNEVLRGNWKSRKAGTGTGTGTVNWKRSSGAVLVCIAWLLLTPMILDSGSHY